MPSLRRGLNAYIAASLATLLTDPATAPPLTLAITADWGRGKSSLMSWLRQDLREKHFRPVWFNNGGICNTWRVGSGLPP
jgi:hypothetical protein